MNKQKKLYLVDASSIFFRAYYAVPFMQTTVKGKPLQTNALYGYVSASIKILDKFQPQYLVYCFDRPEPSHRVDYYKEYKANREEMPEDLEEQMPYIRQVTDLLGIAQMDRKKYEADDLIGSLAVWAEQNGILSTIISSDKDFAQLIGPQVHLYDPMKERVYDSEKVYQRWGVYPNQIVDYLAITGDASDNIPGVFGIGPKGAKKLLNEYNSLDKIYENLSHVPPRLSEKLASSKKQAYMSQRLARIITDLKLISDIQSAQRKELKTQDLLQFLEQMEFRSIQKKFGSAFQKKPKKANNTFSKLTKQEIHFDRLQEILQPYEEVCVFFLQDKVQLYFKKKWVEVSSASFEKIGRLLSYKKIKWWGYDVKNIWLKCRARRPKAVWDVMISAHLVSGEPSKTFSDLCEKELGVSYEESESIKYLLELREIFQKKMEDLDLASVFAEIELPLITALYQMEAAGISLDKKKLILEKKQIDRELIDLEKKIFSLAGHPFNIASPQQLNYVLFEELQLKKGRKTKTGYSTDSHVLHELKKSHPIAAAVLDYRELFKLKTTYVESLLTEVNPQNSRIHTSFKQTMTATGRLSSVQPNLQNIPIRTERGRRIRDVFVSEKNKVLICADYSQIELRILAHFSQDPGLVQAFLHDEDIHRSTAVELFGAPSDKVTPEQRRAAKAVNFGITYGQTAFGLSQTLGVSNVEGREIAEKYFKKFPKVRAYIESVCREAEKQGYVATLFGRRRFVREILSKNKTTQRLGERIAVNTRIQGTASDIVKKAMIQLHESLFADMLLQIHDEIVFECGRKDADCEILHIQRIMEQAVKLSVPLKVFISYSKNWGQAGVK